MPPWSSEERKAALGDKFLPKGSCSSNGSSTACTKRLWCWLHAQGALLGSWNNLRLKGRSAGHLGQCSAPSRANYIRKVLPLCIRMNTMPQLICWLWRPQRHHLDMFSKTEHFVHSLRVWILLGSRSHWQIYCIAVPQWSTERAHQQALIPLIMHNWQFPALQGRKST